MDLNWGKDVADFRETQHQDINNTNWIRDPLTGAWFDDRRKSVSYSNTNALVMEISRQPSKKFAQQKIEDRPEFKRILSAPKLNFRRDNDTWAAASVPHFSASYGYNSRANLKSAEQSRKKPDIRISLFKGARPATTATIAARALLRAEMESNPTTTKVFGRRPNPHRLSASPYKPAPPKPYIDPEEAAYDPSKMIIAGATTLDLNSTNSMFADKILWLPRK